MKALKAIAGAVLWSCVFLTPSYAAGIYDGAWVVSSGDFVTLSTNSGSVLAITLDDTSDGRWEAYLGSLNGNSLRLTTIYGYADVVFDVYFTSLTTAYAYQRSCVPHYGSYCKFPNNTRFDMQKFW